MAYDRISNLRINTAEWEADKLDRTVNWHKYAPFAPANGIGGKSQIELDLTRPARVVTLPPPPHMSVPQYKGLV